MNERFVIERPDGGITVIVPVDLEATRASLPPGAVEIQKSELPSRLFRDAWVFRAGQVQTDMPKARSLHVASIERARKEEILDLLEREALGESVASEKAAVRAVNAASEVAGANTPEELAAVWPPALNSRRPR